MKKEIQIHAAVTRMGDRLSVNPKDREDLEICQFAVAFPAKFDGAIKRDVVEESFRNLAHACIQRMRAAGILEIGE